MRLYDMETKLKEAYTPLRDLDDYQAKKKAIQDLQLNPSTAKDPELSAEVSRRLAALEKEREGMGESMYQYDKADPYNSEFAPDVGMGRMTLRGWKNRLVNKMKTLVAELERAQSDIDTADLWKSVHRMFKSSNMEEIMKEIELAHAQLDAIRRKGGVNARAFNKVAEEKEVWDKPNPKKKSKKLSPAKKAAAKRRAKAAGRPYPNMIDNIWAAKK